MGSKQAEQLFREHAGGGSSLAQQRFDAGRKISSRIWPMESAS